MEIKGFIESSLLEWEGKIASVIFLPYCNLRCRYCHAAHLILNPDRLESIARHRVLGYLAHQKGWVDGVAITGGEPTLHGDDLTALIKEFRAMDLGVLLETNGTQPDCLARLLGDGLLDAVAMDVKAPLTPEDYRRVTQVDVDVERVRASIEMIKSSGLPHEFRTTIVPGLIDRDELERLAPHLAGARQIAIQNFRPDLSLDPALRSVPSYTDSQLDEFERIMAPMAGRCVVRGRRATPAAKERAAG